jgi:agmatinase
MGGQLRLCEYDIFIMSVVIKPCSSCFAFSHFDAHLDTWLPTKYPSAWIDPSESLPQSSFNHGSMFWMAAQEGLIANSSSVHAGLRTRLNGDDFEDYADDSAQGWTRISTDDIDEIGTKGIVQTIIDHVGLEEPVYLSVDIDVIDPGYIFFSL